MENVILMASGLGTRMRPLTETMPKPLIDVNNKPMIETIIDAFVERGVSHFYVVVGYLSESFEYLRDKYSNLTLLTNKDYMTINNISSIYTAREELLKGDCFICEADLYVSNPDILKAELKESCYFGKMIDGYSNDWVFELDEQNYISRVGKYGTDCYNMTGIAYFNQKDAETLSKVISARYNTEGFENLFWDDVVNENLDKLKLRVHSIDKDDIVEIDTVEELELVRNKFRGL